MRRQPAYAMFDFAVIMTLFSAVTLWFGDVTSPNSIFTGVALAALWVGAHISGRRRGLSILEYFAQLERPFYKSRDDYSPQD